MPSSASFTVPTIFTAINKFSNPLKGMGKDVNNFTKMAEAGAIRSEKAFKKFLPGISAIGKELLQFASIATLVILRHYFFC